MQSSVRPSLPPYQSAAPSVLCLSSRHPSKITGFAILQMDNEAREETRDTNEADGDQLYLQELDTWIYCIYLRGAGPDWPDFRLKVLGEAKTQIQVPQALT